MTPLTDRATQSDTSTREVTPGGHDLNHWADVRAGAERWDLPDLLDRLAVGQGAALVVLAAHPDDEALGLGRLMHAWSRRVGPVVAIVSTAGEACVDHVAVRPPGLAERRLSEWRAATEVLGADRQHVLGLPDGKLADHEASLVVELDAAVERLGQLTSEIVLAAPWRRDPHPDHRAVGRATEVVAERRRLPMVAFGVWMTYWSDPAEVAADGRKLVVLTTDRDDDEAHRRACAAFVSQLEPLAPGLSPVVPSGMLAHHHQQLLVLPEGRVRS
jgi:LmbE family N-acetylglucosaminyl deacetylase